MEIFIIKVIQAPINMKFHMQMVIDQNVIFPVECKHRTIQIEYELFPDVSECLNASRCCPKVQKLKKFSLLTHNSTHHPGDWVVRAYNILYMNFEEKRTILTNHRSFVIGIDYNMIKFTKSLKL